MNPDIADQLLDQLNWRYATKIFDVEKKIEASVWQKLEQSLILTPSSFGLQPWHFLVVTNQDMKESLRGHSWNQAQVTDCSHFLVLAAKTEMGETEVDEWVEAVAKNTNADPARLVGYREIMVNFLAGMSDEAKAHWAKHQTYIALGQIMASAAFLNIDSCPMEGFDHAEYDRIFDLSGKKLASSVACALGYRSAEDASAASPKTRFAAEKVITRFE